MVRSRRPRRLVPDAELYNQLVAGESLRSVAPDYGVHHTTLSRHLRRPDAQLQLRAARRRLKAQHEAREATELRLEQDVVTRARKEAEHDRRLEAWTPPAQPRRSAFEISLDEHDARVRPGSRDMYSANDDEAEKVVEDGGGVEQIIDATSLRDREDVLRRIDPQIMLRALANDAKSPANARPDDSGLRTLHPDSKLIRRRAAGEPLRSLAVDYGVSHTTLSHYFARPLVAKQLRAQQRAQSRSRRSLRARDHS